MERSRISKFHSTTWAKVTFETVKNTSIWKQKSDQNGFVSKKNMRNVLTAALVELGYDAESKTNYERSAKVMVRSSHDQTKGNMTFIYSFPVKRGHSLENHYLVSGLINFDPERKAKEYDLSEFGLEAYETSPKKQNKLDDEDFETEDSLSESYSYVDAD